MKKLILFFVLFSLFSVLCSAQGQDNIWYFGDSAGISFNSGIAVPLTDGIVSSLETCSSISDRNGNLLFYVGSKFNFAFNDIYLTLWNRQHQIMQNGDTLSGYYSSTQGSLILQNPSDSMQYYIFSQPYDPPSQNLIYSVVDMALDSGRGAVVQKNIAIPLSFFPYEKMQSVKHANGRDWWLIIHGSGGDTLDELLINTSGINNPIPITIGNDYGGTLGGYGQMIFSPDGNKLFCAGMSGIMDLFDFNRCTGVISNYREIGIPPYNLQDGYYGCSISPNNKVLYVSKYDTLFQFDLLASDIQLSEQIIWIGSNTNLTKRMGQHKLGPDGKIYIANSDSINHMTYPPDNYPFDSITMNLSVINYPDSLGAACDFVPYSFYLGGKRSFASLPNNANYNLGRLIGSPCDTLTVFSATHLPLTDYIEIFPNPNNGEFILQYNLNGATEGTFEVFDVLSRKVFSAILEPDSHAEGREEVHLFERAGLYFWRILSPNRIITTGKFIIFD